MTSPNPDNLETQLAALTQWQGPTPNLWRKALKTAAPSEARPGFRRILLSRPLVIATAAGVLLLAIGTAAWQLPVLRTQASRTTCSANLAEIGTGVATYSRGSDDVWRGEASWGLRFVPGVKPPDRGPSVTSYYCAADVPALTHPMASVQATSSPAATDRLVVRRVNIELATPDVRAAYLRAAHLISEAQGEYVQDSALTGSGSQVQANLTLRVAATRLPAVLDQLRNLGKVESEQANGEDVTQQVVDTEARLRNEQRVETELLKLLESRQSAPLTEILQLRDKLREVRTSIEKMVAERDRLSRLVNLATVLVIIRPADAQPAQMSVPTYFVNSLAAAWNRSLLFLADTVALLLGILVGGIIWWCLLAVGIFILMRLRRHP